MKAQRLLAGEATANIDTSLVGDEIDLRDSGKEEDEA